MCTLWRWEPLHINHINDYKSVFGQHRIDICSMPTLAIEFTTFFLLNFECFVHSCQYYIHNRCIVKFNYASLAPKWPRRLNMLRWQQHFHCIPLSHHIKCVHLFMYTWLSTTNSLCAEKQNTKKKNPKIDRPQGYRRHNQISTDHIARCSNRFGIGNDMSNEIDEHSML